MKSPFATPGIATDPTGKNVLRSVNKLIDDPACSNNVQNTTEAPIKNNARIMRCASIKVHCVIMKTSK